MEEGRKPGRGEAGAVSQGHQRSIINEGLCSKEQAESSLTPDTSMLAFSFGGTQGEGGPQSPVSAVGTPVSPCCCEAAPLTGFPERLSVQTSSFLGPVSGQGVQGLAKGRHDGLDQNTRASELSSWASVWLLSSLESERDHFLPQSPLDPEEFRPVSRF